MDDDDHFFKRQIDPYFLVRRADYNDGSLQSFFKGIDPAKIGVVEDGISFEKHEEGTQKILKSLEDLRLKHQALTGRDSLPAFDALAVGTSEEEIIVGGKLRSLLGIPRGYNEEQAWTLSSKIDMKKKIMQNDPSIPVAKYLEGDKSAITSEAFRQKLIAEMQFPVIFKPTDQASSVGIVIARDPKDLSNAFKEINELQLPNNSPYMVEEFIEGETLRVDGFIEAGKMKACFPNVYGLHSCYEFYRKGLPQITYGDFRPENYANAKNLTMKIMKALGVKDSVFHLELIRHQKSGKLYFLENGVRVGGDSEHFLDLYNYNADLAHIYTQLGLKVKKAHVEPSLQKAYARIDVPTPKPVKADAKKHYQLAHLHVPDWRNFKTFYGWGSHLDSNESVYDCKDGTIHTAASPLFYGEFYQTLQDAEKYLTEMKLGFNEWNVQEGTVIEFPYSAVVPSKFSLPKKPENK